MIWDEEIAQKAANWAEQNKFQHNPDISLPSKRFETGENLYLHRSTDPKFVLNLDVSIQEWFDEHKNYRYKKLEFSDFQSSKVIGHYTQMVWADTMYIGCAVSQYQDGKWNSILVVCNYAPRGNKLDDHPYDTQGRRTNGLLCNLSNCNGIYGKSCS
ncbi:GLIPR1-like protein 1 [Hyposmocoma kahamanoa]|uniref:GLIPR1-like protein 1 n=1 Tax=Hyposmocoma kahamanoa TaxID=1477025 RepID=UPI000E6D8F44|nr:GLIPR1-like protein 1 [Hyposmocoma kahamanoa]